MKGTKFQSYNPATQEILWEGMSTTPDEVNSSIQRAKKAQVNWAELKVEERTAYLKKFADRLSAEKDVFASTISAEMGKPLWESNTEVAAMISKAAISLEAYKERCPLLEKNLPTGRLVTTHRPHGVLGILGPYNFPGHLPNGHIIPALLAGNTLVFKPSELTPLTGQRMCELWEQCGLPKGVLNLVQGGAETGHALATHPEINGLLFTGSWKTGKHLLTHYSEHPEKILALEMGGNNPFVIGQIADADAAAYLTIQSAYITSGQRCTCARRLIVPKNRIGEDFLATLLKQMERIVVGSYTDRPEPFIGPVVSLQAAQSLLQAQDLLEKSGGKVLIKMHQIKEGLPFLTPGLIDVTEISNRKDEEYFGPLLQVIRVPNFKAGLEIANQTQYGLAAGLLSDDSKEYEQFFRSVRAGVINWNTSLTGASSSAPFGGIGHSGNYRPSAYYAADYCAYPVASIENDQTKMPLTITPGLGYGV